MPEYNAKTENWVVCQLLSAADRKTPVTGIAYDDADLVVKYQKLGGATTTKALTADDWVEFANGVYAIRFSADECDTPGMFLYNVDYDGGTEAFSYPGQLILEESPYGAGSTLKKFKSKHAVTGLPLVGVTVNCYRDAALTTQHGGTQVSDDDGYTYWLCVAGETYYFVQQMSGYTFAVETEVA